MIKYPTVHDWDEVSGMEAGVTQNSVQSIQKHNQADSSDFVDSDSGPHNLSGTCEILTSASCPFKEYDRH